VPTRRLRLAGRPPIRLSSGSDAQQTFLGGESVLSTDGATDETIREVMPIRGPGGDR
jgi:hypothetical protein